MIAAAGYYKLKAGQWADATLTAHATFPLGVVFEKEPEVRSQKTEDRSQESGVRRQKAE
jgi:hypothetical protein